MVTILGVIEALLSIFIVVVILLHSGKDTGFSGAFGVGGAGSQGGGSMMEKNLNRFTVGALILWVLIAIVMIKL